MVKTKSKNPPVASSARENSAERIKALLAYEQARDDLLEIQKTLMKQLGDATKMELVDLIGASRQIEKLGKKLSGIYAEALKGRVNDDESELRGAKYYALISRKKRTTFDSAKVMAEMVTYYEDDTDGYAEWLKDHQKSTEYTEVSVKPLGESGGDDDE